MSRCRFRFVVDVFVVDFEPGKMVSQIKLGCCKRKYEVSEILYKKDGWNMLEHQ